MTVWAALLLIQMYWSLSQFGLTSPLGVSQRQQHHPFLSETFHSVWAERAAFWCFQITLMFAFWSVCHLKNAPIVLGAARRVSSCLCVWLKSNLEHLCLPFVSVVFLNLKQHSNVDFKGISFGKCPNFCLLIRSKEKQQKCMYQSLIISLVYQYRCKTIAYLAYLLDLNWF